MYCTHCGHQNPADSNFCGNCGRPLNSTTESATTASLRPDEIEAFEVAERLDAHDVLAELVPGTALLHVLRGPNEGARYLLDSDVVTVGRHPDSDIFLDDITVSRRHAELRREGARFGVHDVGSLNGTYVNGRRVEDQTITTGDEVQIGKFKLMAIVAEPTT
jgi:hypothetical protein